MIVVRSVLHVKWNQGGAVVAAFQAAMGAGKVDGVHHWRLLTDLSGRYHTVTTELVVDSLAAWEDVRGRLFGSAGFQQMMAGTDALIEHGYQEFYTIEAEG